MKGVQSGDQVAEIKSRVDIVELISEYVTLKKAGRNFLGLCPFHNEKTPSFTVNRERQMFYCFGCGEKGDVFAFLMRLNNASFPETLTLLARRAGVVLPPSSFRRDGKSTLNAREQIIQVNQSAAAYYRDALFSPVGRDALAYLRGRGLKDSTIEAFGLGYAPDGWRNLRTHLERKNVPLKPAREAGLIIAKEDRPDVLYDRFRNRVMFPVRDVDGRIIAFGGRILGEGEPKYLNSPESPAYTKGRQLYGLSQAKEAIRRSGDAILVEGYFDLIVLWNAGITNVVATLGTALTRDHLSLIRRYAERVAVLFDGDEAGKKALARSVELFVAAHMDARAVVLPEGLDPDDFVRRYGGEALRKRVADAPSIVDHYIENVIGRGNSFEERGDAAVRAAAFITAIEDVIDRNLFIKRVSEKLSIDQDLLKNEVKRRLHAKAGRDAPAVAKPIAAAVGLELKLIHLIMVCPEVIPTALSSRVLEFFLDEALKGVGQGWIKEVGNAPDHPVDAVAFIQRLAHPGLEDVLLKLLVRESPFQQDSLDPLTADIIRQIKRKWYKERHREIKERLLAAQAAGDQASGQELLKEKERLLREEREL